MIRALGAIGALALLAGCATGSGGTGGTGGGGTPPPPPATTLITHAQPFDSAVPKPGSELTGQVSFVWSDIYGTIPGVTTCHYAPAYRSVGQSPAWFTANHPDWIMYEADQKTIAYEFGDDNYTPLDINNPAVVTFLQLEIASRKLAGQTWVCLDNIDDENSYGEAGHFDASGAWVAQYTGKPNDPTWHADNVSYLTQMAGWAHGQALHVMINSNGNSSSVSAANWEALAAPVDGTLKEGWPIDGCENDPPNWINGWTAAPQFDVEFAESVWASAKPNVQLSYWCGHPLSGATPAEMAWVTAVRLLTATTANGNMIAAPGAPPQTDDATLEIYPASMNPEMGPITAAPPAPGARPYTRAFAHGFVALNPTAGPLVATVPTAGADQFGNPVPAGPYTLPPMSAVVEITP